MTLIELILRSKADQGSQGRRYGNASGNRRICIRLEILPDLLAGRLADFSVSPGVVECVRLETGLFQPICLLDETIDQSW